MWRSVDGVVVPTFRRIMPPLSAMDRGTVLAANCKVEATRLTEIPKIIRPRTERHFTGDLKLYWNFISLCLFDCIRKLWFYWALIRIVQFSLYLFLLLSICSNTVCGKASWKQRDNFRYSCRSVHLTSELRKHNNVEQHDVSN